MKASAWLFAAADARACTWLRIGFRLLLAWTYKPDARQRYAGMLGNSQWRHDVFELFFLHPGYQALMWAGIVAFTLGWRHRVVGLALALMLLPHGFLVHGVQSRQILVFCLVCVSLLPSAPVWRVGAGRGGMEPTGPVWPLRLLQFQLSVIYGVNAPYKTTPEFLSGRVLEDLSRLPNFLVDLTEGFLRVGAWSVPVAWLAVGTVLVEYWLAVGLWFRRTLFFTILLGVGFHLTLKFVMRIHMLDIVTIFLYFAFLAVAVNSERREKSSVMSAGQL